MSRTCVLKVMTIITALTFLSGCVSEQRLTGIICRAHERTPVATGCAIDYPPHGAVFPPEIIAPRFCWTDTTGKANAWLIRVTFASGTGIRRVQRLANGPYWQPHDTLWETIKQRTLDAPATLLVVGVDIKAPQTILSAATVCFSTSADSVGDALFYREVTLPFEEAVKDPSTIRWRFGSVGKKEAPVVLDNLLVCGNCHSFSASGALLGMDVDYANDKGSYVIAPVGQETVLDSGDIISWSDYARDENDPTFGLLSQVSPDGRYVVSTVKDRSVFVPRPDLAFSQLFFPIKGILVVYSRESKSFRPLRGADNPAFVQSNAAWSPDQKRIVFARSRTHNLALCDGKRIKLTPQECEEFLVHGKPFRFDLYQVSFNDGAGGTPEPLAGASNNGMSNYFPRFSPNGKWIVFCKAASYMLLQPDSRLYLMPAQGGEPRPMRCNTGRMNSWHSWSSNSRWLVFASKQNSPYTQLFLTHINDKGEDSPPVLLEHLTAPDRAANIPEFVNAAAGPIERMEQRFVDDVSYWRSGKAFEEGGDYASAQKRYATAVRMNPRNRDAQVSLGNMLELQEKLSEALESYREAAAIDSASALVLVNLGNVYKRLDRFDEALAAYGRALAAEPGNYEAHVNAGHLHQVLERFDRAMTHLDRAIALEPEEVRGRFLLALTYDKMGEPQKAVAVCRRIVKQSPDHVSGLRIRAAEAAEQGRTDEAIGLFDEALAREPRNPIWHCLRADLLTQQGRYLEAAVGYREALSIHTVYRRAQEGLERLADAPRAAKRGGLQRGGL
ncbi:MAG: tetratricopeptide repeat protein [Chitinispirillaceae bacterium]|nr:tetratricopeptide repeat protein [Chitinispirillaceae bacterium]